jgi:hypothetical protein
MDWECRSHLVGNHVMKMVDHTMVVDWRMMTVGNMMTMKVAHWKTMNVENKLVAHIPTVKVDGHTKVVGKYTQQHLLKLVVHTMKMMIMMVAEHRKKFVKCMVMVVGEYRGMKKFVDHKKAMMMAEHRKSVGVSIGCMVPSVEMKEMFAQCRMIGAHMQEPKMRYHRTMLVKGRLMVEHMKRKMVDHKKMKNADRRSMLEKGRLMAVAYMMTMMKKKTVDHAQLMNAEHKKKVNHAKVMHKMALVQGMLMGEHT